MSKHAAVVPEEGRAIVTWQGLTVVRVPGTLTGNMTVRVLSIWARSNLLAFAVILVE